MKLDEVLTRGSIAAIWASHVFSGRKYSVIVFHGMKPDYTIESVARACDVLASFRDPFEMLTLTEIVERSGLNKVTVFRILSTLAAKKLVEKVGPRAYKSQFRPIRGN